jgi:hypothetical protein
VDAPCIQREELIKKVDERIQWVHLRENELRAEEVREMEESAKKVHQQFAGTTTTTKGWLRSFTLAFIISYRSYPSP